MKAKCLFKYVLFFLLFGCIQQENAERKIFRIEFESVFLNDFNENELTGDYLFSGYLDFNKDTITIVMISGGDTAIDYLKIKKLVSDKDGDLEYITNKGSVFIDKYKGTQLYSISHLYDRRRTIFNKTK